MPDLPARVVVGANGAYWRDFGEYFSMCPVSEDNDPIVQIASYERVDAPDGTTASRSPLGSRIVWQDRPRSLTGGQLVGDVPETILPLVIQRLRQLNHEPNTPSRETSLAITHCEEALHWLESRRRDREERGVSGTYTP